MPYVLLGLVLLAGVVLLGRALLTADAATLARFVRWFLLTLVVAAVAFGLAYLVATERLAQALLVVGGFGSLIWRNRDVLRQWWSARSAGAGKRSEVETAWLKMRLDHESGTMTGTVRRGPFQGRYLHELSRDELLRLWRECCAEDAPSARLLESYLDRLMPDWRDAAAGGEDAGAGARQRAAADAMTVEEAYAVLELEPGADAAAIRAAHRRLMMKLHPDHGGSTWLAAKINRAKELLLRRQR